MPLFCALLPNKYFLPYQHDPSVLDLLVVKARYYERSSKRHNLRAEESNGSKLEEVFHHLSEK